MTAAWFVPLSLNEAAESVGEQFKAHLIHDGLVRLRATRFRVAKIPGATKRTYAACSADGTEILLAPDFRKLPGDIKRGIVMHELGHAVDHLYPAQIVLGRGKHRDDLYVVDHTEPTRRQLAAWARRGTDTVERFADSIAERAFGVEISYRGDCLLQSDASGVRPRPRGLR